MKIRFSWLWIPFTALCLFHHMQKVMLCIFAMLAVHECAHLLTARIFHYEIGPIMVYPFGIGARIYHIGHGNVWKEGLIIAAGPATHLFFPLVFTWLELLGVISQSFQSYLIQINSAIFLFNTLLIWPLDGGRILQSLFHLCLPYHFAQLLTFGCSLFNLVLICTGHLILNASSVIVMLFLILQIGIGWRQMAIDQFQFYMYRYQHPFTGHLKAHEHSDLYRQRENLIRMGKGWMNEHTWLRQHLTKPQKEDFEHSSFMI